MKYTAITDGGKYGVQPTMEKPLFNREYFSTSEFREYRQNLANWVMWDEHLLTLPRYLRTQGLELLPDGEEFEARIRYEFLFNGKWIEAVEGSQTSKVWGIQSEYHRQVLAPLVKDQDVVSVHQDSSPVATLRSTVGNSDEQIHIPLKNIEGYIGVSKSVSPEIIEALNKMAELAYQSLTPNQ